MNRALWRRPGASLLPGRQQSDPLQWRRLRRRLLQGGLLCLVLSLFLLSLMLGSVTIPPGEVLRALSGAGASANAWESIVLLIRLPKALTALLAGAALGVSGLLMQTLFRNPLAGPYVLGISSGASLGVALVLLGAGGTLGITLLTGLGPGGSLALAGAAMGGAALVLALVLLVARAVGSNMTLLVLGVMLASLTSALVSMLLYFSVPEQIQAYVNWSFGSFGTVSWRELRVMAPLLLTGLALAALLAKPLDALLPGEALAQGLGLNVRRARLQIMLATAVLAGTVTAFCGPVGFLGIAVPHLCRSLAGTSGHRTLLPACMLGGAALALVAALVAELPGSNLVLPLNAVMALLGAPVVIHVLLRRRNLRRVFAS
ncbi:MAG: iron ABC transporter permease [Anaerolineaceae bacterium]|nr:iron ABC transporter permease [Anaerolineaceae bacterium]